MPVDLYLYNGTNQTLDTTSSMSDLINRTFKLVPPGQQAHLSLPDTNSYVKAVAQFEAVGAKDVSTIASLSTYVGVSHSQGPHVVNGKQPTIV